MDSKALSKQYYAKWVNVAPSVLDQEGVFTVFSPERDKRQPGYGRPFDLYCLLLPNVTIISYGQCFRDRIDRIERCFRAATTLDDAKAALRASLGIHPQHAFKYIFTALPPDLDTSQARQLDRSRYHDFLAFRRQLYPDSNQGAWLKGYFEQIADADYVYGISVDGQLVSATEVPDLPYMQDEIVEPGINTLPGYRRRGYATIVVGALFKHLLEANKVPIWSCAAANVASQKLAERVGYAKFADVLALTRL